jgi:uncharacterized Zn-finger protein
MSVTKTECKYCGTEYSYVGSPMATVYSINEYAFKPEVKSKIHDTRQPMTCNMCGAEVLLGFAKLKNVLDKRKKPR